MADDPPARRREGFWLPVGLLLLAGIGIATYLLLTAGRVNTDDATIAADVVPIMPRVSGYVVALRVTDNEEVRRGQDLLDIDPRPYQLAVDAARTALTTARRRVDDGHMQVAVDAAQIAQDRAKRDAATSVAALARDVFDRKRRLSNLSIAIINKDTARADATSASAQLVAAQRQVEIDRARMAQDSGTVATSRARAAEAAVTLRQAQLNLSYTRLTAPIAGTIANRVVDAGNYAEPGQLLLSLVPDPVYVIADFRETQICGVRPGDEALVDVDARPGKEFRANIDSIQRGTGSVFALLPPENATGNFVKVVQRVPVKLLLDDPTNKLQGLGPGLSVEVSIKVTHRC